LIEHHLREGSIVPVAITCALIHRAMDESQSNNFLIDGFPRNKDNLTGWAKEMGDKTNMRFVLFFECSQETCLKRCLKRGAEGSGRSDDNAETLQKRFVTYMEKTMPIVEHYRKLGLVKDLDANGNEEEVFDEVKKIFAEMDTK
jgi:UMP-CMP kinase